MVKQAFVLLASLASADDETTMLSLRQESASSMAALRKLRSVADAGKNVTQMELLVKDIAMEAKGDVTADQSMVDALEALKVLVDDIQSALLKEHRDDQVELDRLNVCFQDAKAAYAQEQEDNQFFDRKKQASYSTFKTCRENNEVNYENWINKCEALDSFIAGLEWLDPCTQECVWDERDAIAGCLARGVEWYKSAYATWSTKHSECLAAGKQYRDGDVVCDTHQGTYEIDTCTLRQAEWTTCNDHFMTACDECSVKFDVLVNEIECREKDRKVDHSSSEKIRCYVDVLLTSPTSDELKEVCKEGKDECLTSFRIEEYKKCEKVCENVDFESGEYQVIEGINGTHRIQNKDAEKRCTRRLDINFPAKEGCEPCPELPPYPCQTEFVEDSYSEFQKKDWVDGVPSGTKECPGFIHQEWSAYSLEECRPCPELIGRNPQNNDGKCQVFGDELVITSSMRPDAYINIAEVIVNGGSNNDHWNKAYLSAAYSDASTADKCIDGNPDTICHTLTTTGNFRLKSDVPTCIDDITIINRQTGAQSSMERLVGATISVLNKGVKVWQDGFKSHQSSYAWHFKGKEDIIQRNVCLGAANSHHATVQVPPGTCLSGAEITHRSGYVSCRTPEHGASNFGCDDGSIALVFTQKGSSQVIMPNSNTIGYQSHGSQAHWYGMAGVGKHTELLPMHLTAPVFADGDLDLWYGEDLVGYTEDDNHGTACYDIKLITCPESMSAFGGGAYGPMEG